MPNGPDSESSRTVGGSKDRFWIPRFWDGMGVRTYWRLMAENRCAVAPHRLPMAAIVGGLSLLNTELWALQELLLAFSELDRGGAAGAFVNQN